jgi:hypothetical protein
MNERPSRGSGVVGYMIVLVGVAAFVLSCFVPYTQFFDQVSISYYRLATASRGGTLEYVGGLLLLFGGTATVAWVALALAGQTKLTPASSSAFGPPCSRSGARRRRLNGRIHRPNPSDGLSFSVSPETLQTLVPQLPVPTD